MNNTWHGILINHAFINPNFIEEIFDYYAKKESQSNGWIAYGVIINGLLDDTIPLIQHMMVSDKPYYVHFYKDDSLIVIFKEKYFDLNIDKSNREECLDYGLELGIPSVQLDFSPLRVDDEIRYFGKDNYL